MCTLGHTCTGGCICTLEKDAWRFDVRVNEQCPEAGHTAVVFSAEYSPDGMRIVSGSHDGLVIIWDAANGAEVFFSPLNGFFFSLKHCNLVR